MLCWISSRLRLTLNRAPRTRRVVLGALAALVLCGLAALPAGAATPSSATVSPASPEASWTGGPKLPTASSDCGGPDGSQCDNFHLTIEAPAGSFAVEITLTPQVAVDDYDLQVWGPDGSLVGSSGSSTGEPEQVVLSDPAPGVYTVSAAPFAATSAYAAGASLSLTDPPPAPSTETPPRDASTPPGRRRSPSPASRPCG